jgi:hypothetical protein
MRRIIGIIAALTLTAASLSQGEGENWIPLGATKQGEIFMVALQESQSMRKVIGEWLPLQVFEADGKSEYFWRMSSLTIKDQVMSLVVIVRNKTLGKETEIHTSFGNDYPSMDLKKPWEYVDKEKNHYLLPEQINSEKPVYTSELRLLRADDLAQLEKKVSITKAAVFWKWSELIPTKF